MNKVDKRFNRLMTILIGLAAITAMLWAMLNSTSPTAGHSESDSIMVGSAAPDFEAINTAGNKVRLSDYKGKVVLMNMWASWCTPCVREMPLIQSVYRSQDHDVETLFVNAGEAKGTVSEYMSQRQFTFPVIIDVTGRISNLYGITGLPATFILDKKGNFSKVITGEITDSSLLRSWIEEAKGDQDFLARKIK